MFLKSSNRRPADTISMNTIEGNDLNKYALYLYTVYVYASVLDVQSSLNTNNCMKEKGS